MSAVPPPTIEMTEDRWNNLIFAIISDSYEEYAMRCAMAGMEPTVSPGAFRDSDPQLFRRSPPRRS